MQTRSHSQSDIIDIKPDHYDNGVPVFKPTMDQFKDFYKFNKSVNKYGLEAGIIRVIPPQEWKESIANCYSEENLSRVVIKNPIVQQINSNVHGVFQIQNIERPRKYTLEQWKELSKKQEPPRRRKRLRDENEEDVTGKIDSAEFSDDRCQELERSYWKSLTYSEPIYGADSEGSLFTDDMNVWNVAKLPNVLDLMEERIPGVNNAYLYAGVWKATFAWHLEDQDLYLINYIHFGAPKQWYLIPQAQHEKFFNVMKDLFTDEYKHCSQFLRHKTFHALPQYLEKKGITVNHTIHREGEFILTYPYGYHAGFNYGYNLAESVNFALDSWFDIAKKTDHCHCIPDAVNINVEQLLKRYNSVKKNSAVFV